VTSITLLITTSGYLIQYQSEQVWLRWIYYINMLALSFSAMMENEFSRIDMTCTAESLIPSGPEYTDINHQVCTLVCWPSLCILSLCKRDCVEDAVSADQC